MGALHNLQRQRMVEKNVDNWTWWNVNFKNCSPPSHRKPHAKKCTLEKYKNLIFMQPKRRHKMQPIQSNPKKKKQKENESPNFQQWTTENCKKKPKANNVLFIGTKQNNITRKNALKKPDWIALHSFFADYFFGSVQKINSHYLLGLFLLFSVGFASFHGLSVCCCCNGY